MRLSCAIKGNMNEDRTNAPAETPARSSSGPSYRPPSFEVISLSCEISAYAPDEDDSPLF